MEHILPVCCDVVGVEGEVVVAARRERMDLSDICNLCATGGILASVAGNRLTSDFISDSSSSNWFKTLRGQTSLNYRGYNLKEF